MPRSGATRVDAMYEVIELSLADTPRLFRYSLDRVFGADFALKGFDYPWVLRSRNWSKGERVLDVGAAYSPLPAHIARTYGCEVWAVDDFGQEGDDPFWTRGRDPADLIDANPEVRYVRERVGDPTRSSLPERYFDCIYSVSTLEHIPPREVRSVWRHMDRLLRPGGEMMHAVDIALPTSRGLPHVVLAVGFDLAYPLLPRRLRQRFVYETPLAYVRTVRRAIGARAQRLPTGLGVIHLVLDPEVLLEPPDRTYNRILKDGKADSRHFRVASLLFHLKKAAGEG